MKGKKKEITYVIGHKNPDTDSVCASIGLTAYKTATGMENVVAARAGDLNPQTIFILDHLGVRPPVFLSDVRPKARDIMPDEIFTVSEDAPLKKAMDVMREMRIRFLPVLNGRSHPVGVLTIMALARMYMAAAEGGAGGVYTSYKNMMETLGGRRVLDLTGGAWRQFSVYVGAMEETSFVKILSGGEPANAVVVVGDRIDIQRRAVRAGTGVLIISGGFDVKKSVIEEAEKRGVSLMVSPHDSATTALLVRLSTPASAVCERNFTIAQPDELVEDLKHKLARTTGIVVTDREGTIEGIVTRSSLLKRPAVNLILVDHNELTQAVEGAAEVNIIEVVDHHRIGGLHTTHAIPFICYPVGSTSTIVAGLFRDGRVPIEKKTASLLLAGVISDTVMLRSPTTTDRDREILKWLEKESGLDAGGFANEIFSATSSLRQRGPEGVVRGDHKVFTVKGRRFGIGQVETIGFDEFFEEKERLVEELGKVAAELDLTLSALLVTDIVMGTSLLLAVGAREVLYNLGYPEIEEGLYELKGVISRKKQVLPHIIEVFRTVY